MIWIEKGRNWPDRDRVEVVERKGLGHPDTIMDSIVEACSRRLSNYYMENFGMVLHHNLDKGVLIAGRSFPKFGGGEVLDPIKIIVVGRATTEVGEKKIPVGELILEASKDWIRENFRYLDPDSHVIIDYGVKPGSVDLVSMYSLGKEVPLANDTSVGASFYPFTDLERIVYSTEKVLNLKETKEKFPFIGEDVKVMGIREEEKIKLIVAVAFVDKFVESEEDYLEKKEKIKELIERKVLSEYYYDFEVEVNTADKPEEGVFYLTVTGTSGESGDDGQVGRGNRVNGLITPNRHMSIEATAGKNARSHVGKIYNVFAKWLAREIYEELDYRNEVLIVSKIGHPITEPSLLRIKVYEKSYDEREIERIIKDLLNIDVFEEIQRRVLEGREELF